MTPRYLRALVVFLSLSSSCFAKSGTPNLFPLSATDEALLLSYGCSGKVFNTNYHPCPIQGSCSFCNSSFPCTPRTARSCDAESTIGTTNCKQPYGCGSNVVIKFAQGDINNCNRGPGIGSSQGNANAGSSSQAQYLCAATSTSAANCCSLCRQYENGVPGNSNFKCKSWVLIVPNDATENTGCNTRSTPRYISQAGASAWVVTPYYGGCGWCFLLPREQCAPECADEGLGKQNMYWALYGRMGCTWGKNDPHFTGADGTRFEFNGVPDKSFCLVSDRDLHINMKMHGYLDERTVGASVLKNGKAVRTWMRELGFVWNKEDDSGVKQKHTLFLAARTGSQREYGDGFLARAVHDGEEISNFNVGDTVTFSSGLELAFVGVEKRGPYEVERYKLSIEGLLAMDLSVRLAHPLLQTPEDAEAHFNIMFDALKQSKDVHGVIGQTYRSGRTIRALEYRALSSLLGHPVAADGETGLGYLDGSVDDYVSSTVLTPDCKFSTFNA